MPNKCYVIQEFPPLQKTEGNGHDNEIVMIFHSLPEMLHWDRFWALIEMYKNCQSLYILRCLSC